MAAPALHTFEMAGAHYAIDPETCFCFECDAISRDVLQHYPHTPVNHIVHLLKDTHPAQEIEEVVGELEWLRGAKSIAQTMKVADLEKLYAAAGGLKKVYCNWSSGVHADAAFQLLLNRSGGEKKISFELLTRSHFQDARDLLQRVSQWKQAASLAGKKLDCALRIQAVPFQNAPAALAPHTLDVVIDLTEEETLDSITKAMAPGALSRVAKWCAERSARVILRPASAEFSGAAAALREVGFGHIEIDIDASFCQPEAAASPQEVFRSLQANAEYYANALLKRDLFRLDPIAGLFLRIYQGTPMRRMDPAGTMELCVDAEGDIYASPTFSRMKALKLGSLRAGVDEAAIAEFENTGSPTTAPCTVCWARNLCGGGSTAAHYALSGSVRTPHPDWSEAQRLYLESAIASFNKLSAAGVNFTQVYESLGRKPKVSLWQAAKTMMNAPLGLRPLAEADAAMLAKWENWNAAAYFTVHESCTLTTSQYDREMDAVHPRGFEQEFVVTTSKGDACGLLRIRPMLLPGVATAWLYLRDINDYQAAAMRKGFRNLINLLPSQQDIQRLLVPAGPGDGGLALFLQSAGFAPAGVQRQALYLHGAWHDVQWYTLQLGKAA